MAIAFVELLVLLILGALIVAFISAVVFVSKLLGGTGSTKTKAAEAEEARLMQELHQGITKLEDRIEALETILTDRERKEDDR